jgi:O-antigen ligase
VLFASLAAVTLTTWREGLWTIVLVLVAVLGASAILLLSRRPLGAPPAPVQVMEWLLLAVAAWGWVQALTGLTVYRHQTLAAAAYWTGIAAVFWLSGRLFFSADPRAGRMQWLLGFACGVALLCVGQRYTSQGKFLWRFDTGYLDIYGPFASYMDYAAFVELIFPWAVFRSLERSPRRWFYAGAAALLFASVVMSASRAGAGLLAGEFFAVLVLTMQKRPEERRRLLACGGLIIAAGALLSFAAGWDRLWVRLQQGDPYALRRNMARSALAMVRERPWGGFGLGNFPVAYPAYAYYDDGTRVNHAHNDWAEWAVEGGLPLAVAMLALLGLAIGPAVRTIWGLGPIFVFAHALLDYPFRRLGVAVWIFFVLAAVVNTSRRQTVAR